MKITGLKTFVIGSGWRNLILLRLETEDPAERLLQSGRGVTNEEILRDVTRMFSENFREWVGFKSTVPMAERE